MATFSFDWTFRQSPYCIDFDITENLLDEDFLVVSADFRAYSGLTNLIKNARQFPDYHFVVFSDSQYDVIDTPVNFHLVRVKFTGELSRVVAKFFKLQTYRVFPNVLHLTWIDANLELHEGFTPSRLLDEYDIQFFAHNKRRTLGEELLEVRRRGKDDSRLLDRLFKDKRYDELRLLQGRFLNSNQTEVIRVFYDEWWQSVLSGSIRDQLSLPIVLSKSDDVSSCVYPSSSTSKVFSVVEHQAFDVSVGEMSLSSLVRAYLTKYIYFLAKLWRLIKGSKK